MTSPDVHPVQKMFRLRPPAPRPGVVVDLVRFKARGMEPEFWTLRLYRDNLNGLDLSAEDTVAIHNWVSDIMRSLRLVEPNVWLEVFETMPRRVP